MSGNKKNADACWPCIKIERDQSGKVITGEGKRTWACFGAEGTPFKSLRKKGNIYIDGKIAMWPSYGRGQNYAEKSARSLCKLFAEATQRDPDDFSGSTRFSPLQYNCKRSGKCRCKICPEINEVVKTVKNWRGKGKTYRYVDKSGKKITSSCDNAFTEAAKIVN